MDRLKGLWESIRHEADDPSLTYTAGAMAPYTSMGADAVEVLAGLQDLPASRGKSLGRVALGIAGLGIPGFSAAGWKALLKSTQKARKVGPYNPNLTLNKMKTAIRRGMRTEPGELVDEDIVEELADHVTKLYSQEGGDIDAVWGYADEVPDYLQKAFEKAVLSIEGSTPFVRELQKLYP
jgi:hypothetical protein